MRVLLVEDDELMVSGIITALRRDSLMVEHIADGRQALAALIDNDFDLCILDLTLPGMDGLDVIRHIRAHQSGIPILVLSARDAVADRVLGLNAGADDYLIKPFDVDELIARVHVLERRKSGSSTNVIAHKALSMNIDTMQVTYEGREVELQPNEFKILRKLLESPSVIHSKEQMETYLYGWGIGVDSNTINVYIHGIRKKIANDIIKTIRGIGYKIT